MRPLVAALIRSKNFLNRPHAIRIQKAQHSEGPPQPFDNMPFSIPNRYVATLFFALFFGVGLWAPFLIVWYSMAKRTLSLLTYYSWDYLGYYIWLIFFFFVFLKFRGVI